MESDISGTIRHLLKLVDRLEKRHPGRHFTLDGHIVGSLGEVYAKERYKLDDLFAASNKTHDARKGKRLIQIKTTQGDYIGISSEPQYLLVLKLSRDGSFAEIYNGPGKDVWSPLKHKKRPKNGQYQVQLTTLQRLMQRVPKKQQIA